MNMTRLMLALALAFSLAPLSIPLGHADPERISPEYFSALREGSRSALERVLEKGVSPDARDASGNTPLMLAAVYGDTETMRLLLDRGANANATNNAGATALIRAAFDAEKVALLLARGADVHARSALGNTALMLAARPWNSRPAVEMLLRHGADVNATNLFGATALMAASAGGDLGTVDLLLQRGAKVNAQAALDPGGFLLGGGRSALMWSAFRGDVAITQRLLEAGADANRPAFLGTPLNQAIWSDRVATARLLVQHGADVNQRGAFDGFGPLHWAASTERNDPGLVTLLLAHGANPNLPGGEDVDAFLGTPQTPLMLARRRGDTPVLKALVEGGAAEMPADRPLSALRPARSEALQPDRESLHGAMRLALPLLQRTAIESKQAFVRHSSRQDCTSCHQQMLPLAAIGLARKQQVAVDSEAERALIEMVLAGDLKDPETDWQAVFHPEPAHSKGYTLLALAAEDVPPSSEIDAAVHHLSAIQGKDGQWYNNLPRPPLQTDDIGATALAVHALQRYPLPGRRAQFAAQVERARRWLREVVPQTTEGRSYQLLGLAWAGESPDKLTDLADRLVADQRTDGGWGQLPRLDSDAYATGQAIYALRVAAGLDRTNPAVERGLRYLLSTQLDDGTWRVRRRAFPFQPTMNSGFPHGRDAWISAAATSWAVMAMSVADELGGMALKR